MRSKEEILQLKAELEAEFVFICECAKKNMQMTNRIRQNPAPDEFDYSALGYTLHNLYSAFENYFLRISRFFENNIPASGWHRNLIERMKLDIPGLRPALFSKEFAVKVDELLRFRHVFRNIYQAPLVSKKVMDVNEYAEKIDEEFKHFHQQYLDFLNKLFEKYENPDS